MLLLVGVKGVVAKLNRNLCVAARQTVRNPTNLQRRLFGVLPNLAEPRSTDHALNFPEADGSQSRQTINGGSVMPFPDHVTY